MPTKGRAPGRATHLSRMETPWSTSKTMAGRATDRVWTPTRSRPLVNVSPEPLQGMHGLYLEHVTGAQIEGLDLSLAARLEDDGEE